MHRLWLSRRGRRYPGDAMKSACVLNTNESRFCWDSCFSTKRRLIDGSGIRAILSAATRPPIDTMRRGFSNSLSRKSTGELSSSAARVDPSAPESILCVPAAPRPGAPCRHKILRKAVITCRNESYPISRRIRFLSPMLPDWLRGPKLFGLVFPDNLPPQRFGKRSHRFFSPR